MNLVTLALAFVLPAAVPAERIVDNTTGIANVCPVHRVVMHKQEALVGNRMEAIGHTLRMLRLARVTQVNLNAERKLKFPFPIHLSEPGCGEMESVRVIVYVCKSCTSAEAD